LAVVVGGIITFVFYDPILRFLLSPLPIESNALAGHSGHAKLAVTGIGEGFAVVLKLAVAGGIILAAPVLLYQIWGFLAPALTRREKHYALPFTAIGVVLFLAGLALGFVVLRFPINFLLSFGQDRFVEVITADSYFSFVTFFMLAFAITFELPLVLTFLAVLGVVSSKMLREKRMYILVSLWVASCFITPGADPYSPIILGVSFTFLYFVSEVLIRAIKK